MWNRIKCGLGFHKWSKFRGYYQEEPHPDAVCYNCTKKYRDT